MKKLIFAFIDMLRRIYIKFSDVIFKPGMNEDEKWLSPKLVMKIFVLGPIISVILVIGIRYVMKYDDKNLYISRYKKELEVDYNASGVAAVSDIYEVDDKYFRDYNMDYSSSGSFDSMQKFSDPVSGEVTPDRCQTLLNKVRSGMVLSTEEESDMRDCINLNVLGLTEGQKKALETLMDSAADLTEAERKILADYVAGELTNEDDIRIAEALVGSDPEKKKIARMIINNPQMSVEDRKKLLDILKKDVITPEDMAIVREMRTLYPIKGVDSVSGLGVGGTSLTGDDLKNALFKGGLDDFSIDEGLLLDGNNNKEKIDLLDREIAKVDAEIAAIEKELEEGKGRYNEILKKQLAGEELSSEEIAFAKSYSEKLETRKKLQAKRKKLIEAYAKLSEMMKRDLIEANARLKSRLNGEIIPSSSFVSCSELENSFAKSIDGAKKVKKRRKLTPEELEMLASARKKSAKSLYAGIGKNVRFADIGENSGGNQGYFILQEQSDGKLKLPAAMKIKAVLEDDILISSNSVATPVQIRILEDIYVNNKVVITKNSIATGITSGFDAATSQVNINVSNITSGVRTETVSMTLRVPGVVKTNRGQILTEAAISALIESASTWIRTEGFTQLENSNSLLAAVTSGALTSSSGVLDSVGTMLAEDLRRAQAVFFCPSGVRLILRSN